MTKIAAALEEKSNIPMVRQQLELILDLQTDAYWDDITAPMLEVARKRLRELVKLIDKTERQMVYSDFEDELGVESEVRLPGLGAEADFERFRLKVRQFLREHRDHMSLQRLRLNQPLPPTTFLSWRKWCWRRDSPLRLTSSSCAKGRG